MTERELLDALRAKDLSPRKNGAGWMSKCPAHEDRLPSLSTRITPEGKFLAFCHAGCPFAAVVVALGLRTPGTTPKTTRTAPRPIAAPRPPSMVMRSEWSTIQAWSPEDEPYNHERTLGIPAGGLARIGAAWAVSLSALAVPMLDGLARNLIGVRLRADDGKKWAIPGSQNGLFMPTEFAGIGPIYFPEGMTDTASLVGLGLDAIGRPSANGGRDLVRAVVKQTGRPAVIVTDADEPGRNGANLLASELAFDGARSIKVMAPPPGTKDVRELIQNGATRQVVEYLERNTSTWRKV